MLLDHFFQMMNNLAIYCSGILFTILSSTVSYAQLPDSPQAEKRVAYAELVESRGGFLGNSFSVSINFGDLRIDSAIISPQDQQSIAEKLKDFSSMVGAMNLMAFHGWEFVDAYVVRNSTLDNVDMRRWIIRKTILVRQGDE